MNDCTLAAMSSASARHSSTIAVSMGSGFTGGIYHGAGDGDGGGVGDGVGDSEGVEHFHFAPTQGRLSAETDGSTSNFCVEAEAGGGRVLGEVDHLQGAQGPYSRKIGIWVHHDAALQPVRTEWFIWNRPF